MRQRSSVDGYNYFEETALLK